MRQSRSTLFALFITLLCAFWLTPVVAQTPESNNGLQVQTIKQEQVLDQIELEKKQAEKDKETAEKLADTAEKRVQSADSETEKTLANYLKLLQEYLVTLSATRIEKNNQLNSEIQFIREQTEILKTIEKKLDHPSSIHRDDLNQATLIWRDAANRSMESLFAEETVSIDSPPPHPEELGVTSDKYDALKAEINEAYKHAQAERATLENDTALLIRTRKDVQSRLLLSAGRIRAATMSRLISRGEYSVWDLSIDQADDFIREVKVVPLRFVATVVEKFFDLKALSREGLRGWMGIAKQVFFILVVFFVPFALFQAFKKLSVNLEKLRRNIFTNSQLDFRRRTQIAVWIGRINPYLPWVFAYLTVLSIQSLLSQTLIGPVSLILPYANIYILYKMFLLLLSSLLAKILLSKNLDKIRNMQNQVQQTAKTLSVLFFAEWAFLHATEDAVRRALIYYVVFDVIFILNLGIIAIEAQKWREELGALSKNWLPATAFANIQKTPKALGYLVFPVILFGNIIYLLLTWFMQWISNFEAGKRLTSELFKRRLEEASEDLEHKGSLELPPEYRECFRSSESVSDDIRVRLSRSPLHSCMDTIDGWINERINDDLLLVYGNYGIGKSTLLSSISQIYSQKIKVRNIHLKNKITDPLELLKQLSNGLGSTVNSPQDLEEFDKNAEKTLVIVDDIHNAYLNFTEGLSAYRMLIHLMSLQLENVFWCLGINEKALAHLNGLFGPQHFQGRNIELYSWTDSEIHDLILKRHRKTPYRLKFDPVISAVHKGDILEAASGLEVQFFRLLWGQSRGNPRTAQELWLSAAHLAHDEAIHISVPEFTSPRLLSDLPDDTLMVYAAIVKHENLSFEELTLVCNMPISHLKQALKFGEDGLILERINTDRWRVHPKGQYVVHAQLLGRNLIYG
ncbi:MAG: hypothetical protein KDD59_10210 [Bdellovibrionales bacterium]|nr:hypothetical protein [Bdellovibrionales bacterium]